MAKCAYCGTSILFGGKQTGDKRYCSSKCQQGGYLLAAAQTVPLDVVKKLALDVHTGPCPRCKQRNVHVDVHMTYEVYSVIFYSRWSSEQHICCRKCGVKLQRMSAVYCMLCGWWGGWGWLVTPVQISKNIRAIRHTPDLSGPSAELENLLRIKIAAQALKNNQQTTAAN